MQTQTHATVTLAQLRTVVAEAERLNGQNVIDNGPDAKPVANVITLHTDWMNHSHIVAEFGFAGSGIGIEQDGTKRDASCSS